MDAADVAAVDELAPAVAAAALVEAVSGLDDD